MSKAYKDAGVDIEAGEEVVKRISQHVKRTNRSGVVGGFGGFGALFEVPKSYSDPLLVSGTDGVGTKLLVAQQLNKHRSIGIDLVAMCVNDIATLGAEPLFFLDYFATGALAPSVAEEVVAGIADGCVEAGCALIGGETAEMPGMYGSGHYDLAGFCVGVVERNKVIDGSLVKEGDVVIGFSSSGLHSNGYSLARKLCADLDWTQHYTLGEPLGTALLRPTTIYVSKCLTLSREYSIHAFAHITGGGLTDNIPRVLPSGLGVLLQNSSWDMPPIFDFLQKRGEISRQDMRQTFNCGIGLVVVVDHKFAAELCHKHDGYLIGTVISDPQQRVSWQ
jgi:phosphoribosylformylglycinamidine cyclo-ligase